MKTLNLICNACKASEVIDDTPYAHDGALKIGWAKVLVMELRPPVTDPRTARTKKAFKKLAEHEAMPEELAGVFTDMAMPESDYEPPPQPVRRSADLCPTCAPKILAALTPHLTSESRLYGGIMATPVG